MGSSSYSLTISLLLGCIVSIIFSLFRLRFGHFPPFSSCSSRTPHRPDHSFISNTITWWWMPDSLSISCPEEEIESDPPLSSLREEERNISEISTALDLPFTIYRAYWEPDRSRRKRMTPVLDSIRISRYRSPFSLNSLKNLSNYCLENGWQKGQIRHDWNGKSMVGEHYFFSRRNEWGWFDYHTDSWVKEREKHL